MCVSILIKVDDPEVFILTVGEIHIPTCDQIRFSTSAKIHLFDHYKEISFKNVSTPAAPGLSKLIENDLLVGLNSIGKSSQATYLYLL